MNTKVVIITGLLLATPVAAQDKFCKPRNGSYLMRTQKAQATCKGDKETCQVVLAREEEDAVFSRGANGVNELNLQGKWGAEGSDEFILRLMDKNWCLWARVVQAKRSSETIRLDFDTDGTKGTGVKIIEMPELKTKIEIPIFVVRLPKDVK